MATELRVASKDYFLKNLKQIISTNKIKLLDVQKISGVDVSTLYRILEGHTAPRLSTKEKIANALGYHIDEFEADVIQIESNHHVPFRNIDGSFNFRRKISVDDLNAIFAMKPLPKSSAYFQTEAILIFGVPNDLVLNDIVLINLDGELDLKTICYIKENNIYLKSLYNVGEPPVEVSFTDVEAVLIEERRLMR